MDEIDWGGIITGVGNLIGQVGGVVNGAGQGHPEANWGYGGYAQPPPAVKPPAQAAGVATGGLSIGTIVLLVIAFLFLRRR